MNRPGVVHHSSRCQAQAVGKRERGQSLVEFALILPIVVLVVMGLLMFGIIFGVQITLTDAAAAGVRQAVVEDYSTRVGTEHYNQAIYSAVINAMGWLTKDNIQTITIYQADETGGVVGTRKDVLDKNGSAVGTQGFPNSARQGDIYIGVEVTFRQPVFVPMINLIIGDEIILRGRRMEMLRW